MCGTVSVPRVLKAWNPNVAFRGSGQGGSVAVSGEGTVSLSNPSDC